MSTSRTWQCGLKRSAAAYGRLIQCYLASLSILFGGNVWLFFGNLLLVSWLRESMSVQWVFHLTFLVARTHSILSLAVATHLAAFRDSEPIGALLKKGELLFECKNWFYLNNLISKTVVKNTQFYFLIWKYFQCHRIVSLSNRKKNPLCFQPFSWLGTEAQLGGPETIRPAPRDVTG